ncbi:hypothetical protein FPOAC2_04018 [Fusarium poae]
MAGPFYLDSVVVDEFLVKEFVRNPDLAGPLQNILPMLNKVSKTLRTFGDWLMTNNAVGAFCRWAPILGTFISAVILFRKNPMAGAPALVMAMAGLVGEFREMSQGSIKKALWEGIKALAGQLKWSLLWNPWFIAGAIALVGVIWVLYTTWF